MVPQLSVVLCTYNRAGRIGAAAQAILDQQGAAIELLVVDDGSTDDTPAVLAAIDDPRLKVVRRPNGGLSFARNSGLAAATAPWVVFIDDDDTAQPGWAAAFVGLGADPTVGIACVGAQYVKDDGTPLFAKPPARMGPPFGELEASTVAGTFAARTDLVRRAGGYLDGLGTRHQTELFIRMLALAGPEGLRVASVPDLLIWIEARPPTDRPGVNPRRLYDGTRWIMARHPADFEQQSRLAALFDGVAGTNAARLGDWRAARRRLRRAVRADPTSREAWSRLALATVPAVGERVWQRHGAWSTHNRTEVGVLRQPPDADPDPDAGTGVGAGAGQPSRELFLAWRYEENPVPAAGGVGPPDPAGAPAAVSTIADRVARRAGNLPVVEIAVDRAGGWSAPTTPRGGSALAVCTGLHRADDPVALLHALTAVAGTGTILLATPDRIVSDPGRPYGPPSDPGHRREWTLDQLELLLLSCGLDAERWWHVSSSLGGPVARLAAQVPTVPVPGVRRDTMVVVASARPVLT